MKRKVIATIALIMCIQLISTSALAANTQSDTSARTAEIKSELAAAEDILGGPCKLASEKTQIVGNYIVENRLYVIDAPATRASSGKVGGVSSQAWRPINTTTWHIKVLLAGFFYYNGSTAMCIPEETDVWAVTDSGERLDSSLEAHTSYSDGATAKVVSNYLLFDGSEPAFGGKLSVTCSKTGEVGYETEDKYY